MSEINKKKLMLISVSCSVVLLSLAAKFDLAISQTVIDYNSWFGTLFQTVGEFPVYLLFVLVGEIVMAYAIRQTTDLSSKASLFLGGLGLAAWQTKQYTNELLSYFAAILNNLAKGQAIGLANSDTTSKGFSPSVMWITWLIALLLLTCGIQFWLKTKSDLELKHYVRLALVAALTVWFALEVNLTLKDLWGRVRPYELSSTEKFTSWLQINGVTGHKSFPSGHTMAGTLAIVFSWFVSAKRRKYFFTGGVIYGILTGLSRVRIGAHFFSDVVFSFFLTAWIIYLLRELSVRLKV